MEQKRYPIFSERFAQLRGEQTQAEFADYLGISRPTVGFYENGTRIPDALVLRQIAERCNVSTDWLLGLSNVRSTKAEIRGVCEYTGFQETVLEALIEYGLITTLNNFISSNQSSYLLESLRDELCELGLSIGSLQTEMSDKNHFRCHCIEEGYIKPDEIIYNPDSAKEWHVDIRLHRFEAIDCFTNLLDNAFGIDALEEQYNEFLSTQEEECYNDE